MPRNDQTALRTPVRRTTPAFTDQLIEPLSRLRSEMDRLFDDFPGRWPAFQFGRLDPAVPVPAIDMTETDKAYKLSVEVAGMDASDIDVSVDDDMLVISGEKKEEREEKEKGYLYSERSYGSFERRIQLPATVDGDKIEAKVKKGVLRITLPKNREAEKNKRRIAINAE